MCSSFLPNVASSLGHVRVVTDLLTFSVFIRKYFLSGSAGHISGASNGLGG